MDFEWKRLHLAVPDTKHSMFLIATILILTAILLLQPIARVNAQPMPGDYIVIEQQFPSPPLTQFLSTVTPGGVRTIIFPFAAGTNPAGVAIDSAGNYIVTELSTDVLSKVTPGGVRTVIFPFAAGTVPQGVAIDSAGNYIVTEVGTNMLSKVTPGGVRTVIFPFLVGTGPLGVAVVPTPAPAPTPRPVGGVFVPVNKFAILVPYLALISLVGAVTTVFAVRRRRKS